MTLPLCTTCQAPAIAFKPGTVAVVLETVAGPIILARATPGEAWCRTHWLRRFGNWDLFTQTEAAPQ